MEAGTLCSEQQRSCLPVKRSEGSVSLLELWAASVSDFYMYILYMGLATPTVTSFLVSQLLPLLPSIPAAFLTLPTTQVLLVTSPARPDCRN